MGFFKKIISNYIDRIGKKVQQNDPTIKRLKKQEKEIQSDIEKQLIEMFGSLDEVPPGYRKTFLKHKK